MRAVAGLSLWIGTARDARDLRAVLDVGVEAVVDLAVEEPPVRPTRELLYLRFPLLDGDGNPRWLLRAAVRGVGELVADGVPMLVACSAGTSRSPAVVAVALARVRGTRAINEVMKLGRLDLSPGLWNALLRATDEGTG